MNRRAAAYDRAERRFSPVRGMVRDPEHLPPPGQAKWLTWLTLAAGAVMCVIAVLLS